jgi:hypothetical protein
MTKRGLPPSTKNPPGKKARRRKASRGVLPPIVKWIGVAAVIGLLGYCASEMSGVAYGEAAIRVVDFSILNPTQKRSVLKEANSARCTCGCGLTLAGCVSTDMTCPIREPNIERIKTMVQKANRP